MVFVDHAWLGRESLPCPWRAMDSIVVSEGSRGPDGALLGLDGDPARGWQS